MPSIMKDIVSRTVASACILLLFTLSACGPKLTGDLDLPPDAITIELPAELSSPWLERAKNGDPEAQYQLGLAFVNFSQIQGSPQAHGWLERAAAQGHAEAMFTLAQQYYDEPRTSQRWLEKAAKAGHADAMYRLGLDLAVGDADTAMLNSLDPAYKLKPLPPSALKWWKAAAELDHLEALDSLGWHYLSGKRVAQDIPLAPHYLEKAGAAGYSDAYNRLGYAYRDGQQGIAASPSRALHYFLLAAGQKSGAAEYALSLLYASGAANGKPDMSTAMDWLAKAAEHGDQAALVELGKRLATGDEVPKDPRRAAELWEEVRASYSSNDESRVLLGLAYQNGAGVTKSPQKAAEIWAEAAKYGNAEASFLLGKAYLAGAGIPSSETQAAILWRQAAQQGHPGAQDELAKLCSRGTLDCNALESQL